MIFNTRIAGIPCKCEVTVYYPGSPAVVHGSVAIPPEPEEFEFLILDRKGYPAKWLEAKLSEDDVIRLYKEYQEQTDYYRSMSHYSYDD